MQPSAMDIMVAICERSPLAALIPTIFLTFLARATAVAGWMLHPVRLGTLYIMIGVSGTASAIAV